VSPTVHEFKIRRGVTFHNGREMDASDVKYSFERVIEPKTGSPFRAIWSVIDKVETPDKWTARFTLKYPSAPFLNYLAGPYGHQIVAKEAVEKHGDLNQVAVGTGPFKLKEWRRGEFVEYVKNPDYFVKGRPYLDGLKYVIISERGTRTAALQAGRLDTAGPGETTKAIADVARGIEQRVEKMGKPEVVFPIRSLGNVRYEPKRGYFEIGKGKSVRTLTVTTASAASDATSTNSGTTRVFDMTTPFSPGWTLCPSQVALRAIRPRGG